MDDRGKSLREALAESRLGKSRWRCPQGLRADVVDYAKGRRAGGDGVAKIADELGVSESGLLRWLRSTEAGFREVRIRPESPIGRRPGAGHAAWISAGGSEREAGGAVAPGGVDALALGLGPRDRVRCARRHA